jgi:hypothetical protein
MPSYAQVVAAASPASVTSPLSRKATYVLHTTWRRETPSFGSREKGCDMNVVVELHGMVTVDGVDIRFLAKSTSRNDPDAYPFVVASESSSVDFRWPDGKRKYAIVCGDALFQNTKNPKQFLKELLDMLDVAKE